MRGRTFGYVDRIRRRALLPWVRFRYRSSFANLQRFCLFVGYPRSGHSIVGAMLNAHPNIVIAHEAKVPQLIDGGCDRQELCARLMARAIDFHREGNLGNYPFAIPGQWQGRVRSLQVIGDKRGGLVTRRLADDPTFLEKIRSLVQCPLRLVHVVRNPFDNIAAISLHHDLTLTESVDFYFKHCAITQNLEAYCKPEECLTIHHEEMIEDPPAALTRLCNFLDVDVDDSYLKACASVVFQKPTLTRKKVKWSQSAIDTIQERISRISFLDQYSFIELESS